MKKLISILLCLSVSASMLLVTARAEQEESIENFPESLNSIWLPNSGNEGLKENLSNSHRTYIEELVSRIMSAPDYAREKLGLSGSDEEQTSQIQEMYRVDYESGLKIYYMNTNKYFKQYFENNCLDYLFSDNPFWAIPYSSQSGFIILDETGACISERATLISQSGQDFIKNSEEITKMLSERGETKVNDIKIIIMDAFFTFLYLNGDNNDYMIRLYDGQASDVGWIEEIECFKLYSVEEIIQKIINFDNKNTNWNMPQDILAEKSTYSNEAEALQTDGLLQGNENGLDLLKPLTRAEAVTLLVRALGLEGETANYTISEFSDIPSDNWAAPYASLAKAYGITDGVTDMEFAPDDYVTSDQFATFTLRAAGESDFDYTEGTEILIDKGIITSEQSETMDLFTRGDMAKIIYESREKGLL